MQLPRPGPDTDVADRGRIDGDEHDVAAGLTRERAKPQIGQRVLHNAAQPGQERKREHACNKEVRSKSLHAHAPAAVSGVLFDHRRTSRPAIDDGHLKTTWRSPLLLSRRLLEF